jgi:hypothetical protein
MALFSGCQARLAGKSELSGHLSPFDIALCSGSLYINCRWRLEFSIWHRTPIRKDSAHPHRALIMLFASNSQILSREKELADVDGLSKIPEIPDMRYGPK